MKKTLWLIVFSPLISFSQSTFVTQYDSSRYNLVEQTADSGYIMGGFRYTDTYNYIAKTNNSGNIQWAKRCGGGIQTASQTFSAFHQTFDGGYIIGGRTQKFGNGAWDGYLIKTDQAGNLQWSKTFGGAGNDEIDAVIQSSDSNFIMAGTTTSFGAQARDFFIGKISLTGNLLWSKIIGTPGNEYATDIKEDANGNIILLGYRDTMTSSYVLCKMTSLGNILWAKMYSRTDNSFTSKLVMPQSGGFIFGGYYYPATHLLRTDNAGTMIWNKSYSGLNINGSFNMTKIKNENIVYACTTAVSFGSGGYFVLDTTGQFILARAFGYNTQYVSSVNPTFDGGWVSVTGDKYLFKDYLPGNFCNTIPLTMTSSPDNFTQMPCNLVSINAGALLNANTILTPYSQSYSVLCVTGTDELNAGEPKISIYPNPASDNITVSIDAPNFNSEYELSIYNSIGEKISEIKNSAKTKIVNVSNLSKGIYLISITGKDFFQAKKITIE